MNPAIAAPQPLLPSHRVLWASRILSALLVAFFAFDAIMKVIAIAPVIEASTKLGYAVTAIRPLGLVLLLATVLFAVPRTAVLGALLLTAYLGGATATMVIAGQPFYFPVVFGVLVWTSLSMRRPALRTL